MSLFQSNFLNVIYFFIIFHLKNRKKYFLLIKYTKIVIFEGIFKNIHLTKYDKNYNEIDNLYLK